MAGDIAALQLEDAFRDAPALQKEILQHLARYPESYGLLQHISQHIIKINQQGIDAHDGPNAKRRKLDSSGSQVEMVNRSDIVSAVKMQTPLLQVPDISFSIPQRKKLTLAITETAIAAIGASGTAEFGVFVKDIDFIACLPVPEKAAKQWNFCVFVKNSHGFNDPPTDPLLFTVNDSPPKNARPVEGGSPKESIVAAIGRVLPSVAVVEPDPEIFRPLASKSYRKDEIPSHVNAHLGTKEGFLFFLKGAIIWGFKKPLQCFVFESIDSSSYSSITQRTFSLTIKTSDDSGAREVEFSMIDQAEHPVIDEYLRENELKDASMSEARRAKLPPSLVKENVGKRSELQAAEEEIAGIDPEDDDDEEDDEDYTDNSEADSLDSDDSDDSESNTRRERPPSKRNLAEEELGSELEDVDITDDEDDEGEDENE